MCTGNVANSLDNRGQPSQDVAGKVKVCVFGGRWVNQEDEVGWDVTDEVADEDSSNCYCEARVLIQNLIMGFFLILVVDFRVGEL